MNRRLYVGSSVYIQMSVVFHKVVQYLGLFFCDTDRPGASHGLHWSPPLLHGVFVVKIQHAFQYRGLLRAYRPTNNAEQRF